MGTKCRSNITSAQRQWLTKHIIKANLHVVRHLVDVLLDVTVTTETAHPWTSAFKMATTSGHLVSRERGGGGGGGGGSSGRGIGIDDGRL